ncbi:DUF6452 family protein [Maribacter algicola]|uniref:DUF6452 family protein n=1 Tax=Meishania litoralis TaxID=3434685 RepID=A0ACC7LPJ5_9FLAO
MRIIKFVFFFLLIGPIFLACEKDDICVDADTPFLVIRFYDFENQTEFKSVPALRVLGVGNGTPVNTFADRSALDSIAIPLKVDDTNSAFNLIANSADDENDVETGNIDNLTLTYTTKKDFRSRACGYTVTFEDLAHNLETDADNWIKQIVIDTTVVANSASAHVKIYH